MNNILEKEPIEAIPDRVILKPCKEYHSNRNIKKEYYLFNEKKHGPYKYWDKDGQLSVETIYKNGKEHGPYKHWWFNDLTLSNARYASTSSCSTS